MWLREHLHFHNLRDGLPYRLCRDELFHSRLTMFNNTSNFNAFDFHSRHLNHIFGTNHHTRTEPNHPYDYLSQLHDHDEERSDANDKCEPYLYQHEQCKEVGIR